ncbi:MAG: murein biosynthesis integral membrane protein MurJ [Bacillota bacterium]
MPANQRKSLFAAASLVALAAILSRLLGYVREVLLAAKFGATTITDAYLVAQEIPAAIYYVVSVSLVLAFIPIYRDAVQKRGAEAAWRLVNSVLNLITLFFAGLWLVGEVAAPLFIPLLAPGFTREALALTVGLTRSMLPLLIIVGVTGLSAAVLNANRRFGPPAFFGLTSNVVVVGALALSTAPEHIHWVAYAVVGGSLLGALIQVVNMPGIGYRYQAVLDLSDPALRRLWSLLIPVMIATSVTQVQTFAARFVASHLEEGTISFLNYAARVSALPFSVIGLAVTTVIFPTLAEQGAAGQTSELKETVRNGLRTLAFILMPMAMGCFVFAEPITRLMFERGAFTPEDTRMTAYALQFFSLGILFTGWIDMLNRSFYALQDSITPMWTALLMMGLNIGLNFLLVDVMGHGGLALSASASLLVGSLVLIWRLKARVGALGTWTLFRACLSYAGTSLLGAAAGWWLLRLGTAALGERVLTQAALLAGALSLILLVHLGAAILFKTPDGDEIRRMSARVVGKLRRT